MRHLRKSYLTETPDASRPVFPREKRRHCGKRVDLEPEPPIVAKWFECGLERGHAGPCQPPGTDRYNITLMRAARGGG